MTISIIATQGCFAFLAHYINTMINKSKTPPKLFIATAQGIDLTVKPRGRPRIYTEEEIHQHKRDYYNNCYYIMHKEACLERMRN